MVKMKKKNNDKYVGLGTSLVKCYKLLAFDCLFDDDKELSDPIDTVPLEVGAFIIGVKSCMRVTNV